MIRELQRISREIIPEWVRKYFLLISAIGFIIVYLFWLKIFPFIYFDSSAFDKLPISNLLMGLRALKNYVIFGMLFSLSQNRKLLRILFLIPTIFYFGLNFSVATSCFPTMVDTAKFDGVTYYLTYNHQCILDEQHGENYLVVLDGEQRYELFTLSDQSGDKIVYDGQTKTIGVVQVFPDGEERLVFALDENPRDYEWYEQFNNHLFYSSRECVSWKNKYYGNICDVDKYKIYQCEMDNTSCAPLPMQYLGKEVDWSRIEVNETTKKLEFYVVRDSRHTLVLSYDDHPHCHVEGCQILSQP